MSSRNPQRQLSEGRQLLHYAGMGALGLGLLLFLSVFVTAALNMGDFSNFEAESRSSAIRAVFGMILMMAGGITMSIGRAGPAGVGIIPDPEQARKDLEPWNRAQGGMINDALSEVEVLKNLGGEDKPVIKVRCPQCRQLNDEDARFCKACGQAMA